MGTFEDLTGKQFYKLTVLYRADDYIQPSGQHKRMWHCVCECGKECDVRASDLKSGNTRSCGCFQEFSRGKSTFMDLTGKKFGRLTVLYRLPDHITPSGQKQRMWHCKCDCGTECDVYSTQLKNGKDSCGCKTIEEKRIKQEIILKERIAKKEEKQRIAFEKKKLLEKEKEARIEELKRKKSLLKDEKTKRLLEQKNLRELEKEIRKNERIEQNNFALKYPELLKEWDYKKNEVKPSEISPQSTINAWWICSLGHSYDARIYTRTGKRKSGCPYCSSPAKRVLKGFNDLNTKYPEISSEWHPSLNNGILPSDILCGSGKKYWWLCPNGHEYEQSPVNRVNGAKCPYCSHQKLLKGFNDFATTNPELLDEWDYEKNDVLPSEISGGVHKKIWWRCPFGHSYQTYPSNRCGQKHSGCPICDKENHTSFPEQALFFYVKKAFPDAINSDKSAIGMELDIYIPSLKIAIEYDGKNWHRNNKYEVKKNQECKKNNILLMRIREEGLEVYDDCYCVIRENLRSNESLSKVIKQVLFDIDNIQEIDVDVDEDSALIYSSYIKGRKSKSLKSLYPELAKEWHPSRNGDLTPEMVAPAANKKVWWLCPKGHEYLMEVGNRTNQNCNCPICVGKKVLKGFNDFETWCRNNGKEILLEEWDYSRNTIRPFDVTKSSDKPVYWICKKCGNKWRAKLDHRTRVNSGCPKCRQNFGAMKKVKCIETGEVFISIQDASIKMNINRHCIGYCCKGKQKTAGGYHWKYV